MMYLILTESVPTGVPMSLEERKKIGLAQVEMLKKDVQSGEIKMIGVSPAMTGGFLVVESSAKTMAAKRIKALGSMKWKISPMLSLEEYEDVLKEL